MAHIRKSSSSTAVNVLFSLYYSCWLIKIHRIIFITVIFIIEVAYTQLIQISKTISFLFLTIHREIYSFFRMFFFML